MVDVIGLGDAGIDIITHVSSIPKHDEKILASHFERHTGGVIANFLCALAKLGTSSSFVGVLGNDDYGRCIVDAFQTLNIDTSRLIIKENEETYFCVSMLDESGEKALIICPTSAIFPRPEDITRHLIMDAKLLHTTGLFVDATLKAFSFAKQQNMLISLDLEPSTLAQGVDKCMPVIAQTDILFVNRNSCKALFPEINDPVTVGKRFLEWGPRIVVATRGADGAIIVTNDTVVYSPAFCVPVVDTTGAGDCFNAAFIHGYLHGWSIEETARFSNAAAAISITGIGAQTAQPTQSQVFNFLKTSVLR